MLVLLVAALISVTDQVTKQMIRDRFGLGESLPVIDGFFDLTYIENTGAAWGMMKGQEVFLIVISLLMVVVMLGCYRSLAGVLAHRVAFGLLLGGIVGNLMDRIRLSAVTDFLDFYVGRHHWPAFNIADSAICVGVAIYLVSTLLGERPGDTGEGRVAPAGSPESDSGGG